MKAIYDFLKGSNQCYKREATSNLVVRVREAIKSFDREVINATKEKQPPI